MEIFRRPKYFSIPAQRPTKPPEERLWIKCPSCSEMIYVREFERNLKVCIRCGHHFRLGTKERLELLADPESFSEIHAGLSPTDPLHFVSHDGAYVDRLRETQERTGLREAVTCGSVRIKGHPAILAVMDFAFLGASMGSVVGEKITRSIEEALTRRLPLVTVATSGGARMHEGILSLMQMAKTAIALAHLGQAHLPYISILTDPTTGGVLASFASLGDVVIAEPGALIGFAGPRVIEQTTRQKLPPGFQTAEFLLEHGMIDLVVPRSQLRDTVATLLGHYASGTKGGDYA